MCPAQERAKKEVNTEKLAEEVKKFIEEQSGKEESEIPSLDKIKEVAEKSKVMGDAEIAAQAKASTCS